MRKLNEAQTKSLRDCISLCDEYVRLGQQLLNIREYADDQNDPALSGFEDLQERVDGAIDNLIEYNSLFARYIATARLDRKEQLTLQYMDEILAKQNEEYDHDKAQADYYEECAIYDKFGPQAE